MSISALRRVIKDKKLDAIAVFSQSPSFKHVLGQKLDHGLLLITKANSYLFASELANPNFPGIKTVKSRDFAKDFKSIVKREGLKKCGFDNSAILHRQHTFLSRFCKPVDVSEQLAEVRIVKSEDEVEKIRGACKITDMIFSSLIKSFSKFKTEKDIELFIRLEILKHGCEPAFDPIVASGKNAAVPHHTPLRELNKGYLVIDFGARYKGYCSDMTRTVYLGVPSPKEISIYNKVLKAQMACISAASTSMTGAKLHALAEQKLGSDKKYFAHALGHGLGIEVHEKPAVGVKAKSKLKKGCVITIEPGYYNKERGIGIRIEDDVYLGQRKEILNKSTKKLICIKR